MIRCAAHTLRAHLARLLDDMPWRQAARRRALRARLHAAMGDPHDRSTAAARARRTAAAADELRRRGVLPRAD